MTDAEQKRSDDETQADAVRRRLVETVRQQLDELRRSTSPGSSESDETD